MDSRNQLNFFTNSQENPADQIFIFFSDERSVGVKTMRKCVPLQVIFLQLLTLASDYSVSLRRSLFREE